MITGMPRIAIAVLDFDSSLITFREKLGMPVVDLSENSVQSLGAKLAMCVPVGGSHIELMSPADPSAPLSQSLQRFLERRGEGLFALMLEAANPNAEAEALSSRGLNVLPVMANATGRDIHPNSTHGVLVRVYPTGSFQAPADIDPADDDGGLSGIVRVMIAVRDLDHAMTVYGHQFAMDIDEPSTNSDQGVRSTICRPPTGGVIELVSVLDADRPFAGSISNFLDNNREGLFALVLNSQNPVQLATTLAARGLEVNISADESGVIEIQRESAFGVRLRIEAA